MPSTPTYALQQSPVAPVLARDTEITDLTDRELFRGVPKEHLQKLIDSEGVRICKLKANERLQPTRESDHIYVILDGYVAIWNPSHFNPLKNTFLAWRGPEQIIGEMREEGAEPSPVRVVTCDACEFLEIRYDDFDDLTRNNPQIFENIANLLVKKMGAERQRSEVIQTSPARRRIAQTLLSLAQERCSEEQLMSSPKLKIPGIIHQEELGQYAGIRRETVSRHLVALKTKQIISYTSSKRGSNEITIRNRDELKKIAEVPQKRSGRRATQDRQKASEQGRPQERFPAPLSEADAPL